MKELWIDALPFPNPVDLDEDPAFENSQIFRSQVRVQL